jgi:hypothetical protein
MKVIGERAREKISGKKLFGALILIPILAHRDLEGCVQYNPTSILESITLLILVLNYLFFKYSLLTIRLLQPVAMRTPSGMEKNACINARIFPDCFYPPRNCVGCYLPVRFPSAYP